MSFTPSRILTPPRAESNRRSVLALAAPTQILVTRTSAKLVMAAGMILVGTGILWAPQVPAHGHFWANLAALLFLVGGAAFAFITVSIGALAAAALTGGFQWAFGVTGLTAVAAVPVTFLLIRRTELARAVAASLQREPSVAAAD